MVNIKEFNSWCLLIGLDNKDIKELSELFTYEIPGAYFMKGPNWLKYKCLLEPSKTPGWYKFPTGLMYKIKHFLQDKNIPYEVEDCREKPKTKKYFSFQSSFKNPEMRYYQKEIIDKSEIYSRGVIEAATGCGKSLIMVNLIKKLSLKTLVVVPSLSILDQFYDLLLNAFGKRMVGKISSKKAELDKEIIIANYQSLAKQPQEFFDSIDVLLIDEAHHNAAETLSTLNKNQFNNIYYRLNFTATFTRSSSDLLELLGVCGEVIYDYPATKAIQDGFLVKPKFVFIDFEHNVSLEVFKNKAKQLREESTKCLVKNENYNKTIADITRQLLKKKKATIIFVDQIEHGEVLSELLPEAIFINGEKPSKENKEYLKQFNDGKINCLIGTSVISEGVDTIRAEAAIIAHGGKSEIETVQRVGRLLRPCNGKSSALVVDFIHKNTQYLLKHSKRRKSIYKKEYDVEIVDGTAIFLNDD